MTLHCRENVSLAENGLGRVSSSPHSDRLSRHLARIFSLILATGWVFCGPPCSAQNAAASPSELKFAVILSRHGVRSPTWTAEELNRYSSDPWPDWGVAPGELTAHGKKLMTLFGAYDHAYLAAAGLLHPTGCEDAGYVHFRADTDQRSRETGRALAAGMLPGCSVEVHSLPGSQDDPLFSPVATGLAKGDGNLASAAVLGRIGGHPAALNDVYRHAFDTLREVLFGCPPQAPCPAESKPGKQSLLSLPSAIGPADSDHLTDLRGPVRTGSTLAEDFLLEYTNGMTGKDLGWGRLDEAKLREVMRIHTAYSDLLRWTPYIARVQASNLMSHILQSIKQAVTQERAPGSLGKPGDRVLVLVGHDTNISNVAGMLGISWLLEDYQRDDTPPGGALVFELWRRPREGDYAVSTYYMAQSLEQMRKALPLSLDSPPAKAPVFLPGCSAANEKMTCPWKAFLRTVEGAIDPAFVKP